MSLARTTLLLVSLALPGCSMLMSFDEDEAASDGALVDDGARPPDADDTTPDGVISRELDAGFVVPDAFVSDAALLRGSDLFGTTKDTYVRASAPTFNFGITPRACADKPTDERTMLIQFAPEGLPAGAVVEAAELRLWTSGNAADLSIAPFTIHELLEPWDEGVRDGTAGTANWTLRRAGTSWSQAGASGSARSTVIAGTFTPLAIDTQYVVAIDPAVVNRWLANPATNYGIAVVAWDVDGACFVTREGPPGKTPELNVTWRAPAP